jgi:RNA polymerase sigma-70 factor, ECF subfamily
LKQNTGLNDQLLINQCKQHERRAQKQLFEDLYVPVFRLARRYVVNSHDAEEVLGNAFIRVFNNIDQFEYRGEGSLLKWINTIVINECIRFLSRYKPVLVEEDVALLVAESGFDDLSTDYDAEEIQDIIDHMPAGYRTVFNLFAMEGYSHQQIAFILTISEGTSKSQLSKARNYIIEKLKFRTRYGTA